MSRQPTYGKVILASAGPGDPELVTVKTARWLAQADIVLTDRLVSPEILSTYVNPQAEIVYVGKQCRRGVSTPQATINELLVTYALKYKTVVRLKGGDTSIFSNVLDELETLVQHQIPYEIVPGVTAALGAAAYAGIPLTARGLSVGVRLLTYYKSDIVAKETWQELAQTDDTLVFYMSGETLATVVEQLTSFGIDATKKLAVIEQATTPLQQIHTCSLYDYAAELQGKTFRSPSLVIIGKVVALHERFAWLPDTVSTEHYFQPLTGRLTQLAENTTKKRHVSRA
ncbi:uroporphyrinogen-III C-methyltransferase [Sediminibacterium goheungense]|uniref:uroporphyrinogen-III C-methyltransferase n=1 Tax=Sediminibacterium goheungense TaxID=1086393 RepID=A0A4R6J1T1_9BACT|nr:uroporphyrinogen-III C-methyltransferase [Sediminibacterium goheungense]TDO29212.1 uroporphyrin-III C-methyltransferase/precorrin-2 dehydrogenase/sirohydrochlorin ferrochelatase/uroporphyrin-III C-methyltransferase [Sediminibacterium goheungense]